MKRTPIRAVSRKRRAENTVRAGMRVELFEERGWKCERCKVAEATDWHERLSRARLGSITDKSNAVILCRACHSWVTTHPRLATQEGWLKSRWGKWQQEA